MPQEITMVEQRTISSKMVDLIIKHINHNPIQQGVIGLQVPSMITVEDLSCLHKAIFDITNLVDYDIQLAILPPPHTGIFSASDKTAVESIGRRVRRDYNDGVRYNRVYIALYWDDLGKLNAMHHDIFFSVEEQPEGYLISISDNREFGGDTRFKL